MIKLFGLYLLATFTITEAQVFENGGYYPLSSGQSMIITNKEYPNGYPLGSARQAKIRTEHFNQIKMECRVVVGATPSDCTDYNGVLLQLDGTPYLNSSNVYQICNSQQTYQFTSRYNTVMIGHYSMPGEYAKRGAWYCRATAVPKQSCDCGWRSDARIVGGTFPKPNAYPSMVVLLDGDGRLRGGGTIIASNVIATAAHTISDGNGGVRDLSGMTVQAGRYNITQPVWADTIYSEAFKVLSYKIHPNFDEANDRNDVALLYTEYLPESKGCGPVCLPNDKKNQSVYSYQNVYVLGWGSIEFGGPNSKRLKEGLTQILPTQNCPEAKGLQSKICTKSQNNTRVDSCQGDSGGPVLYFDQTIGRYRLLGITQSGIDCGGTGINENVPYHLSRFIMPNIQSACLYS